MPAPTARRALSRCIASAALTVVVFGGPLTPLALVGVLVVVCVAQVAPNLPNGKRHLTVGSVGSLPTDNLSLY